MSRDGGGMSVIDTFVLIDHLHGVPEAKSIMVGAAARYPFTDPEVRPATICRWKNMNMISGGTVMMAGRKSGRMT